MAAIESQRFGQARAGLQQLLAAAPRDPRSWLLAAEVEYALGCYGEMKPAIERAAKLGAPAAVCDLLRARAASGCGEVDASIPLAERAMQGLSGPSRFEAAMVLGQSLLLAARHDDLARLVASEPLFRDDPRGWLFEARVARRSGDAVLAERKLRDVREGSTSLVTRRIAGFELVNLLDSCGRFDEAFDVAKEVHATTTPRFDTRGLVIELERCASLAAKGAFRLRSRPSRRVEGIALIASLPRSGTTLLEQMLDRHPKVRGLGEIPAVETLAMGITALGGWPDGAWMAEIADLDRLQAEYVSTVRSIGKVGSGLMTLDKTLDSWRRLPAIAAALPGAKLIRLRRDPRDNAISIFLSNLHWITMGWNASLESIRHVIEAERRCVPVIAKALEVELLDMGYESLVEDPATHLAQTLEFLGLPPEPACLAPEQNTRIVVTLSHEQVRRPLNRSSIGRWRNYGGHFGPEWEGLGMA